MAPSAFERASATVQFSPTIEPRRSTVPSAAKPAPRKTEPLILVPLRDNAVGDWFARLNWPPWQFTIPSIVAPVKSTPAAAVNVFRFGFVFAHSDRATDSSHISSGIDLPRTPGGHEYRYRLDRLFLSPKTIVQQNAPVEPPGLSHSILGSRSPTTAGKADDCFGERYHA
jgi:hypothetical protein